MSRINTLNYLCISFFFAGFGFSRLLTYIFRMALDPDTSWITALSGGTLFLFAIVFALGIRRKLIQP